MSTSSVKKIPIQRIDAAGVDETEDSLAVEEPLEIRLKYVADNSMREQSISVTMRTPGNDAELATGFLFTEGIIAGENEITEIKHQPFSDNNIITITLQENVRPETAKLERHFYTTSSCGVCGKTSIDAVRTACKLPSAGVSISVSSSILYELPNKLREEQEVFEHTGGLHACALFDEQGNLILTREDVGRHNALDKLIGALLQKNLVPLDKYILLLSGRASFELIQKAAMAGIRIVAAVGAPSSLAVELANEFDITLIGFLRDKRFNIYTGGKRVML